MKTPMKGVVAILCIISSLYLNSGCTDSDFIVENDNVDTETMTHAPKEDENLFYYYFDEKIYLEHRTDKVFLEFAPETSKEQFRAITNSLASLQTRSSSKEIHFTEGSSFNTIILESQVGQEISPVALESFRAKKEIVSATYMLEYNNSLSAITNEFSVKLKESTTYGQLQELATKNNCTINEHEWFDKNEFMVSVPKSSDLDAIRMANLFYETGLFIFTSPNFVRFNMLSSNDTYYSDQWGMKNTGQYGGNAGIDINVEQAWTITRGSSNIKVAVLDAGVDLTHPDLQANLLPGYDASGQNTGGASSTGDNHGTAVAGIIGAIKDNGKGISGVAPECKIIPVRVGAGIYIYDTWAIAGFNWARQNGADVINCSWGGGQPNAQLTSAINTASSNGRGGKGCVVVFAAGNQNLSTVSYPAYLSSVIAVGAISYNGRRKDPSTPDRENWGSNYGSELDVVAPGVLVSTTDLQGVNGYNPNVPIHRNAGGNVIGSDYPNRDYTVWFNGTSAAAPFVSGIAALVLSKYPSFTSKQVQMVIEKGCRFRSMYGFVIDGHPNGLWNKETGYGLVDASEALREAYVEMRLDIRRSTPGIDFKIINNSSYELEHIYIHLTGDVGGIPYSIINNDPGTVYAGKTLEGIHDYPGNDLAAAPGTAITNLNLEMWAHSYNSQEIKIVTSIDNSGYSQTYANFNGGNTVFISLPNSSVPSASRRTLEIIVSNR